jgi:hypothetical protein
MIIIWGSRLFGKVDDVPGMFHVATKFGHLWYIPLIPMGSHLVFAKTDQGWRGAPIPFSSKSMVVAWLRAALVLASVIACLLFLPGINDARLNVFAKSVCVAIPALVIGLTVLAFTLKPLRRASYKRAVELARHVKFNDEGMIMLELLYGRITQEEADRAIKQAQKDREEMQELECQTGEQAVIPPV